MVPQYMFSRSNNKNENKVYLLKDLGNLLLYFESSFIWPMQGFYVPYKQSFFNCVCILSAGEGVKTQIFNFDVNQWNTSNLIYQLLFTISVSLFYAFYELYRICSRGSTLCQFFLLCL